MLSLKKCLWWCDKFEKINVDKSKYLWLKCIKKEKKVIYKVLMDFKFIICVLIFN